VAVTVEIVMAGATVLAAVAGGGVVWGAAKAGMNGTRRDVGELKEDFAAHVAEDRGERIDTVQRLSRIETKLNSALGLPEDDR